MSSSGSIVELSPRDVQAGLAAGEMVLIDVREPFEHAEARIGGAELRPLGGLDPDEVRRAHAGKRVVFHCVTGGRSAKAAERFRDGDASVYHLAGGIEAWVSAGLDVERSAGRAVLPVMRQVQITAGSLVAAGTALGVFVHPGFLGVPAFVGCGLVFAGASGWCGMAKLLAVMPWNRSAGCAVPATATPA